MLVLFMIAGLILAGCQVDTHPLDVAHFSTNRAPTKEAAEYDGTFILYRDDDAAVIGPILTTVHLKASEIVGFEIDGNQVPFAVAGPLRLQLSAGRYRWEMMPDAGQTDWPKTNVAIIEVAVATVVVAIAVVSAIIASKHL